MSVSSGHGLRGGLPGAIAPIPSAPWGAGMGESLRRRQITHSIEAQLAAQTLALFSQTPDMVALPVDAYGHKVAFRGQAIALMNTCAQAAVIASSGAANALNHPARRVQGEAVVFSVSGQSTDSAIASLDSLMKRQPDKTTA